MTVCRSMLASERGEMDSARFLVNLAVLRGVEKRVPGWETGRTQGTALFLVRLYIWVSILPTLAGSCSPSFQTGFPASKAI